MLLIILFKIIDFYEYDLKTKRAVQTQMWKVLFDLEKITNETGPLSNVLKTIPPHKKPFSGNVFQHIKDYTGNEIAVIGMRRDPYLFLSESGRRLQKPFTNTYSVYSAVLVNIKATMANKIYYPTRRYMEDIEFNHKCNEKKLAVCKCHKYFHRKVQFTRPAVKQTCKSILEILICQYSLGIEILLQK